MNKFTITSIILTVLGIIASLSGSDLFWLFIIGLPIVLVFRLLPKIEWTGGNIKAFLFLGFIGYLFLMSFIESGEMSFGQFITFIYIFLGFIVLGRTFTKNTGYLTLIIISGFILSIFITSGVETLVNEKIKQINAKTKPIETKTGK